MFSRWKVTNITSASVTTFLAILAGIISWSVYCTLPSIQHILEMQFTATHFVYWMQSAQQQVS
jgi:hypothetical protein